MIHKWIQDQSLIAIQIIARNNKTSFKSKDPWFYPKSMTNHQITVKSQLKKENKWKIFSRFTREGERNGRALTNRGAWWDLARMISRTLACPLRGHFAKFIAKSIRFGGRQSLASRCVFQLTWDIHRWMFTGWIFFLWKYPIIIIITRYFSRFCIRDF